MTSTKKKRVSKKLKVSWRKHVNINDVEDYLEETRLEERLGPPLATISDNELFKLDTEPATVLTGRESRKLRINKPLKCFAALQPHTKVPDPITKRNRVRTPEERKNALVKRKEIQNKLKGLLKQKDLQSLQDKKLYQLKRENRPKRGEYTTADLWGEDKKYDIENDEWANIETKKHNLKGVGIPQKSVVKTLREKKSLHPAIEAPHPGMSYNPSFQDHQDLLKIVADKETEYIKKEEYLTRVTRGMFNKVTPDVRDNSWLVEMSEGIPSKTNHEDDEASDGDYKSVNPAVKNVKKTRQQRRKQKEQMELELKRNALKVEKRKLTDIHQIKMVKKNIEKVEKKQSVLREKRKKVKALKAFEPKRLSATKYEDPGLEFNLGGDISGNLRNLKREGSILTDRFRNLQKRNILQPSVRTTRKNAKVKRFTKPGHKEDWKKNVAKA